MFVSAARKLRHFFPPLLTLDLIGGQVIFYLPEHQSQGELCRVRGERTINPFILEDRIPFSPSTFSILYTQDEQFSMAGICQNQTNPLFRKE